MPRLRRNAGYTARSSHFTHIPWPGPDAWRVLTEDMREQLVLGLLGANVVGFHTTGAVRAFLATVEEFVGEAFVDHARSRIRSTATSRGRATTRSRSTRPVRGAGPQRGRAREENELRRQRPERMILRVDRTDPSKNIVRGFHAFDRLLAATPNGAAGCACSRCSTPRGQAIPEYAEYLGAGAAAAREVNDQYARTVGPIDLRVHDNFPEAVAAYKQFDVSW